MSWVFSVFFFSFKNRAFLWSVYIATLLSENNIRIHRRETKKCSGLRIGSNFTNTVSTPQYEFIVRGNCNNMYFILLCSIWNEYLNQSPALSGNSLRYRLRFEKKMKLSTSVARVEWIFFKPAWQSFLQLCLLRNNLHELRKSVMCLIMNMSRKDFVRANVVKRRTLLYFEISTPGRRRLLTTYLSK